MIEPSPVGNLNTLKDRAFKLLSMNVPPSQVASALGCSPSYISQLLAIPEFTAQLAEAKATYLSAKLEMHKEMDDLKDSIEDKLLKQLDSVVSYINKPSDLLLAVRIVNQLKRAQPAAQAAPAAQSDGTVKLSLPAHLLQRAKVQIQISPQNEILATGDQEYLSPPKQSLAKLPAKRPAKRDIPHCGMEDNLQLD